MMKPIIKMLGGFFITLIALIVLNCIINNNLPILSGLLIFVVILFYISYGIKDFWKLAKYWTKFALFLIAVFVLFGICKCSGFERSCLIESFLNGSKTALILLNTVFILELFILSITIDDILSINLPIKFLKILILLRTLMKQVLAKFENDKILFNIIPEFQVVHKSKRKNLKPMFLKNIIHIMTLMFFIEQQGEILGQLIDNRIIHTHKTKANGK